MRHEIKNRFNGEVIYSGEAETLKFQDEINAVIQRYCDQGITNAEAIGVLEIVKIDLWESLQERAEVL